MKGKKSRVIFLAQSFSKCGAGGGRRGVRTLIINKSIEFHTNTCNYYWPLLAFDHLVIKIRLFFTSNLLQPSGVMLRPAIFSLKVYRAEDIPQSENMFFILSHGSCPFSVSCLKPTNIYLLLSFLCRVFKR